MNRSEAGKLGARKSKETKRIQKNEREQKYLLNPIRCAYCDAALPYHARRNKFCNHSCAASLNNKKYIKRTHQENTTCTRYNPCKNCGTLIDGYDRKFCNSQCAADYRWKIRKQEIIDYNGFVIENRSSSRRFLIDTQGHKCSICGLVEWNKQLAPLVLDHIDGNADNNTLDNLRLVCGNCNMQLPTFTGKNKGNGRSWRRLNNQNNQ